MIAGVGNAAQSGIRDVPCDAARGLKQCKKAFQRYFRAHARSHRLCSARPAVARPQLTDSHEINNYMIFISFISLHFAKSLSLRALDTISGVVLDRGTQSNGA